MSESLSLEETPQENEELTIEEEYKLWRKNCHYMYDFISETALTWPSLSIQWLPQSFQAPSNAEITQSLLLTTLTSGKDTDYLKIAGTQLPDSLTGKKSEEKVKSRLKVFKKYPQSTEINRARYMPQNPNIIGTINASGQVFTYDVKSLAEPVINEYIHHKESGYGISWNRKKEGVFATSSDDKTVAIWNINHSKPLRTYEHKDIVNDVAFHNFDVNIIGSVSDDKSLKIHDTRTQKTVNSEQVSEKGVNSLTFSTFSENLVAVGGEDFNVSLFDLRNLTRPLHSMVGHTSTITSLSWDPHHENIVASGSADRRVILWDISKIGEEQLQDEMEDGVSELFMMHGGHTGSIYDLSFNPDIPWTLASCSNDNIVHLWTVSRKVLGSGNEEVDLKSLE